MTFLYLVIITAVTSMFLGMANAVILSLFTYAAYMLYTGSRRQPWRDQVAPMIQQFNGFLQAASTAPFRMKREMAAEIGVVLLPTEELLVQAPAVVQYIAKNGMVYEGGSRGIRVAPVRGVSFTVGGHRGKMVANNTTETTIGWMVLTSQRLLFAPAGAGVPFHLSLDKLAGVSRNGAVLTIDSTTRNVPDFTSTMLTSTGADLLVTMLSNPDAHIEFAYPSNS